MLSRDFRIQKSAAAAEKAEPDTRPHELTNIRVQEVSVVDAPANRRKFLITKRDRKTVKADSDVLVVDAADVIDLTKTAKGEVPGAELDRADAERLKAEREAQEKADREAELKLTSKAETPPEEPAKPAEEPAKPAEEPVTPPAEEPAAPAEEPAKPADDDQTPGAVDPIKITEEITAKAAELAKVGRPMQRKRLERLKEAWKTVSDILGELEGDDKEEEKAAEPPKTEKAEEPKVEPPKVEAKVDDKGTGGTAAPVTETVKSDPVAAEVVKLTTMVEALQKMVKQQGEELAKSRQAVDSNTISLEKSENDHDKVHWHGDMASPQARVKGRHF